MSEVERSGMTLGTQQLKSSAALKVGDLVFHVEDLNIGIPCPGIVTELTDLGRLQCKYARVVFSSRTFSELHPLCDLLALP